MEQKVSEKNVSYHGEVVPTLESPSPPKSSFLCPTKLKNRATARNSDYLGIVGAFLSMSLNLTPAFTGTEVRPWLPKWDENPDNSGDFNWDTEMYIDADDNGGDFRRETEMYIDANL